MKKKISIILLSLIVISCSSSKKKMENKEQSDQTFFKINSVYSELIESNYRNLYYFNSENNTVYFSKIKMNDSVNKTNKSQLTVTRYGEFELQKNTIKIQKDIEKTIKVRGRNFFKSILFVFLPIPRASKKEITIVDKEIITEGEIKEDTIFMNKMYLGTKTLEFKKKKSSKIHTINSFLIYEPKFKGIIKKDDLYNNYSVNIMPE